MIRASIIKEYQVVPYLLLCTWFWPNLHAISDRDCPPTDRNIPAMSEITLHDIALVSAIWLVDKPLRWHLTSIFGKRTVNAFWGCMERTHGIAESQASTCWMCSVQKLSEIRRLYPIWWFPICWWRWPRQSGLQSVRTNGRYLIYIHQGYQRYQLFYNSFIFPFFLQIISCKILYFA